ncbi:MAG: holo-ACP synthase [Deltaproteobacteria bacterium]|nr:holo-ACP synthase [Deltaproteobacteria bacterium]
MRCVGVDIVEIARLEKAIAHHGEGFLKRIYTDSEIKLYRKKLPSLAARFAAKEAVVKAMGKPGKDISLKEIEILSGPGGQPVVNLYGKTQQQAKGMGLGRLAVTISHSKEYAVAFVSGDTK